VTPTPVNRQVSRMQTTDDPNLQCRYNTKCTRVATARGMCCRHYRYWRAIRPARAECKRCSEDGCVYPTWSLGLCLSHYRKFRYHNRKQVQK
jgi:hypothetical protein